MAHKKKKKLNVRRLFVFLLFIYIIVCGTIKILHEPVRNIIIKGNTLVSDKEIINLAGIKDYPPIASLNISKMKKNIKTNNLINDVKIRRNIKSQVIIDVDELKVICLDRNNDVMLLENGVSIPKDNYVGIPILINYTPGEVLKKFLKGMGELDYGTLSGINEIEYKPATDKEDKMVDDTRFLLKMNDGNMVYINLVKLKTLKSYQKIYASLGDKKGILHLDSGEYLEVK